MYAYDPRTFRLTQLRTTRPATELPFPAYRSNLRDDRIVQQLHYTYDAGGNIVEVEDEAWAPVFFRNQQVEPRSLYVYDALNRLIEATGRESAQLGSRPPGPVSESFEVENLPTDRELREYRQLYKYDSVGNFLAMRHIAVGGGWTREYETAADSNRLLRTWTGRDEVESVRYDYDLHGSMLNLANVSVSSRIRWDWRDMIERIDCIGGGQAWYAYDIGKQRTRKRIERLGGAVEERFYLGGMELYRRSASGGALVEEIETHHLFVDDQRILLVDDVIRTSNERLGEGVLLRYQYGNHLGSVALELDEEAQIIGCEECHPYGTTAYHLVNRTVRATSKRYRYTGMERDEETGLSYHTARYYLTWLGRWKSADPISIQGGLNLYVYSDNKPVVSSDQRGMQTSEPITEWDLALANWLTRTGIVDAAAGFGDFLSGGNTREWRRYTGSDTVDTSSSAYEMGGVAAAPVAGVTLAYLAAAATPALVSLAEATVVPLAQAAATGTITVETVAAAETTLEIGVGLATDPGEIPDLSPSPAQELAHSIRAEIRLAEAAAGAEARATRVATRVESRVARETAEGESLAAREAAETESEVARHADESPGPSSSRIADLLRARSAAAEGIQSSMDSIVSEENARLAAAVLSGDRALLEQYLRSQRGSVRRVDLLLDPSTSSALRSAFYGQALERMVAARVAADARLSGVMEHTGNVATYGVRGRPDWNITEGPLRGWYVDLTTNASAGAHSMRTYGERQTLHVLYSRPTTLGF